MASKKAAYDKDFYQWTKTQASLLKNDEFKKLDIGNLIEEIESLGRSEKRALESYLANLFLHLLKMEHQPSKHSRSWDNSVKNASYHARKILKENPSLKRHLGEIVVDAYFTARLEASSETGLDEAAFAKKCPWKIEEILKSYST